MDYIHECGIAHRDIKPDNVLIAADFTLKIADFGVSALLQGRDGNGRLFTLKGSKHYIAPEVLLVRYGDTGYDGVRADMFACMILLFMLVTGEAPFGKADPKSPPYSLIYEN
jgi:serine/threonine protein kinase